MEDPVLEDESMLQKPLHDVKPKKIEKLNIVSKHYIFHTKTGRLPVG
jgi:hypothetical protein